MIIAFARRGLTENFLATVTTGKIPTLSTVLFSWSPPVNASSRTEMTLGQVIDLLKHEIEVVIRKITAVIFRAG